MCPVCIATAAMIAGGTAGSGGLTALTIGLFRRKNRKGEFLKPTKTEEIHHGDQHQHNGTSKSRIEQ
jgi:hypothetical protein